MDMERGCLFVLGSVLFVLFFSTTCWASGLEEIADPLTDVILPLDQTRLEQVLLRGEPYVSLEAAYHVALGAAALRDSTVIKKARSNACKYATSHAMDSLEDIFYVSSIATLLGSSCKFTASAEVKKTLSDSLKGKPTSKTFYYALNAMGNIGMSIDKDTVPLSLVAAVERDDTPLSYAHAFLAAARITNADLAVLFDQIEDIVAQADETPSTLYFEGGLKVTSLVISGIFSLAEQVKSKPALTEVQATKLGNFLVSNKYTNSPVDVAYLLTAARTLSNNHHVVPAILTLASTQAISRKNPELSVRLLTLMGEVSAGFTVKVISLKSPSGDDKAQNKRMTAGADKTSFSYPMFQETSGPGQYTITLKTECSTTSPVVKFEAAKLPVSVSFQVSVGMAKLSIVDKDQGVTTKSVSLDYPNTSKSSFQADQHSKVVIVFTLVNSADSSPITIHQAFVRLVLGAKEIFFVATPDTNKQYSFELDVADSAKDFGQMSGTYTMVLVVGDFTLENPFSWEIGSVQLKFPGTPADKEEDYSYSPKPVINYLFQVPDKRPPRVLSTAFTVLVILPFVLMLVVWMSMGVNISNIMIGGVWSILFHIGLGATFVLYYTFWAQLNMFTTLKYLCGIGVFTFITGNKMLKNIAKSRQN